MAETETITGLLLEAGVECPQFRLVPVEGSTDAVASEEGEQISLTGAAPRDLGAYELIGRWSRFSYCMQGRSFDVHNFRQTGP